MISPSNILKNEKHNVLPLDLQQSLYRRSHHTYICSIHTRAWGAAVVKGRRADGHRVRLRNQQQVNKANYPERRHGAGGNSKIKILQQTNACAKLGYLCILRKRHNATHVERRSMGLWLRCVTQHRVRLYRMPFLNGLACVVTTRHAATVL
jgi:hypothetical protein